PKLIYGQLRSHLALAQIDNCRFEMAALAVPAIARALPPFSSLEGAAATLARDLMKGIANRGLYPYYLVIGATIRALKWLGLRVRHAPENMYRRRRDGSRATASIPDIAPPSRAACSATLHEIAKNMPR